MLVEVKRDEDPAKARKQSVAVSAHGNYRAVEGGLVVTNAERAVTSWAQTV